MPTASPRLCSAIAALVLVPVVSWAAPDLELVQWQPNFLEEAQGTALSPGGEHVYVATVHRHSILVYARDTATGWLSLVEEERGTGLELDSVVDVVVSPDGAHVYGRSLDKLTILSRDAGSGELGVIGTVPLEGAPLTFGLDASSPDGSHFYASAEVGVAAFSRDPSTGLLTLVEVETAGFTDSEARGVAVSPDGDHLYAMDPTREALIAFARDSLTGELSLVEVERDGVAGVDGLEDARVAAVSPDGAHLYVGSRSEEKLAVFSRDSGTGALDFVEAVPVPGGFPFAAGLVVSDDGLHVYYAGGGSALTTFARNSSTGELTAIGQESSVAFELSLSPDGVHLYGARGSTVEGYARDADTGALSLVEVERGFGVVVDTVRDRQIAIAPEGAHVYIAANNLSFFERDVGTGILRFTKVLNAIELGGSPVNVILTDDGGHAYVTARDDLLFVFSRDAGTGDLELIDTEQDGVGGVDGLDRPTSADLSPDGRHLYVASIADSGVAVFARDVAGTLTFVDFEPGVSGFDDLTLRVSPEGAHVYVAGHDLQIYARDGLTGELTAVATIPDARGPIAFTADGERLYARTDTARFAIFDRSLITGLLTLHSTTDIPWRVFSPDGRHVYGIGAVHCCEGATVLQLDRGGDLHREWGVGSFVRSLQVSPDGAHLYFLHTAQSESAVGVFALRSGCPDLPLASCRSAQRTRLNLRNLDSGDDQDQIGFRWEKGAATPFAAFGDPVSGTDRYAVCLWDQSGGEPTLLVDAIAPAASQCSTAKPCWKRLGTESSPRGYRYSNAGDRLPDGLRAGVLRAGEDGKAQLRVLGSGGPSNVPMPELVPPVTVQVINGLGECWGVTYSSADVTRNIGPPVGQFQASTR